MTAGNTVGKISLVQITLPFSNLEGFLSVVAVPFAEVIISRFKSLRKMENKPNFTK